LLEGAFASVFLTGLITFGEVINAFGFLRAYLYNLVILSILGVGTGAWPLFPKEGL
jgi:hypothetical protein